MFIPAARERVRITNRSEIYFVLSVDREEGCAYVADLGGPGEVECVPLHSVRPLDQGADHLISLL